MAQVSWLAPVSLLFPCRTMIAMAGIAVLMWILVCLSRLSTSTLHQVPFRTHLVGIDIQADALGREDGV